MTETLNKKPFRKKLNFNKKVHELHGISFQPPPPYFLFFFIQIEKKIMYLISFFKFPEFQKFYMPVLQSKSVLAFIYVPWFVDICNQDINEDPDISLLTLLVLNFLSIRNNRMHIQTSSSNLREICHKHQAW